MRQQLSSSSHFKHQHVFYKVWCQCIRDHQLIITMFYQSFSWIINGGCYNLITSYLYLVWTRFHTLADTDTNICPARHIITGSYCFCISFQLNQWIMLKSNKGGALPFLVKWAGLGVGSRQQPGRREENKWIPRSGSQMADKIELYCC